MKQETGMLLPCSERKKKKSCNKNVKKNTKMLEKYIQMYIDWNAWNFMRALSNCN
jgi:hypothetical protein